MAKGERAKARAARDAQRAAAAAAHERRLASEARRRRLWREVRARLPRRTRVRGQQGILARRRRVQDGCVLAVAIGVQVVTWLLSTDWLVRGAVALVTVLAVPVVVTIALDRRS